MVNSPDYLRLVADNSCGNGSGGFNVSRHNCATSDLLDTFQRAPARAIFAALDTAYCRARTANQFAEGVEGQVVRLPIVSKVHNEELTPHVSSAQVFFTSQHVDRLRSTVDNACMVDGGHIKYPNFVRAWREFRHFTQEELAERAKTTGATVSRVENGQSNFGFDILQTIASALNCTAGDLLTRDPRTLDDNIYRDISAMEERDKRRLANLIKAFREGDLG